MLEFARADRRAVLTLCVTCSALWSNVGQASRSVSPVFRVSRSIVSGALERGTPCAPKRQARRLSYVSVPFPLRLILARQPNLTGQL